MTNRILYHECETLLELFSTHEAASLLKLRFDIDLSVKRSWPQKSKCACDKSMENALRLTMNSASLIGCQSRSTQTDGCNQLNERVFSSLWHQAHRSPSYSALKLTLLDFPATGNVSSQYMFLHGASCINHVRTENVKIRKGPWVIYPQHGRKT